MVLNLQDCEIQLSAASAIPKESPNISSEGIFGHIQNARAILGPELVARDRQSRGRAVEHVHPTCIVGRSDVLGGNSHGQVGEVVAVEVPGCQRPPEPITRFSLRLCLSHNLCFVLMRIGA